MSGFVLTKAAKADLKSIGRYTQNTWGVEQRNRYLAMLDASFHDLMANPRMGRDCSDIRLGYYKPSSCARCLPNIAWFDGLQPSASATAHAERGAHTKIVDRIHACRS